MPFLLMILSWTFGILLAVIGVLNLSLQLAPGVISLVLAFILLPPVSAILESRWRLALSRRSKAGLIILGLLLIAVTVREMEIRTQIDIDAPPDRVWSILSDFPGHSDWNPFIITIEGEATEGTDLIITVDPPEGEPMSFEPTVLVVRPGEELQWLGQLVLPRVFDGRHVFELEPLDDGERTRFHHYEKFRGLLVPLLWNSLNTDTRRGFEMMNRALKATSESSIAG